MTPIDSVPAEKLLGLNLSIFLEDRLLIQIGAQRIRHLDQFHVST